MTYQVITGTLKARTAVHVGSGAGGDLTDALLRRDAAGQPIIPGTTIAGTLRTLATRLAPRLGSKICATLKDPDDRDSRASCDCAVCHPGNDTSTYTCANCHNQQEMIHEHSEEGIGDIANCVRCHADGREHEGDD